MPHQFSLLASAVMLAAALVVSPGAILATSERDGRAERHVLLISVDGLHAQ